MSTLAVEGYLDPKWSAWLNSPLDKFKADQANLLATVGEDKTKAVEKIVQQKATERLEAYKAYQEAKRAAFAQVGADPAANFKAIQTAYQQVNHPGLRKFLDQGEAREAAIAAGSAIIGDGGKPDYALGNLLAAKPALESTVNQNRPGFEQYVAARHAYLKAAANRDELAKEMGGDYEQAQQKLGGVLQQAYAKLEAMRGALPVEDGSGWGSSPFALPPAPQMPSNAILPRVQGAVAETLAPTLEWLVEKRGGDPAGIRGAIGSAYPRPQAPKRLAGVVPTNLQAVIEDFTRYGLIEIPLAAATGITSGAAKVGGKVAQKLGGKVVGKIAGRAAEGALDVAGMTAISPASSTDPKQRAKEVAGGAAVGAVAGPIAGAVGDVVGKAIKPKVKVDAPVEPPVLGKPVPDEMIEALDAPRQQKIIPRQRELGPPPRKQTPLEKMETPKVEADIQATPAAAEARVTPASTDDRIVGLSLRENEILRKHTGYEALPPSEKRTWKEAYAKAKASDADATATDLAREVLSQKNPRSITDVEHAAMSLRAGKLKDEFNAGAKEVAELLEAGKDGAAEIAQGRLDFIQSQIDDLTQASKLSRSETARALAIGRSMVDMDTWDVASVTARARIAKGSKLKAEETAKYQALTEQLKKKEADFEELHLKYVESVANEEKLMASKIVDRATKRAQITTVSKTRGERLLKERQEIKDELTKLGFRVNDITGATSEGSYLIGKLAVNYIKTGANSLDEVVRLVLNDVPALAERDVHKALLAKDPNRLKRARNDATRQIAEIKTHAKLLLDIEATENTKALRSSLTKLRGQAYKAIPDGEGLDKALRTIDELQDARVPDLAAARKKLADLKKELKLDDQLADLEEQLRTGEFKIPEKRVPKKLPPELERKQVEIRQAKHQIKAAIESSRPVTFKSALGEVADATRAIKTILDHSAVLNQGFLASVKHPVVAAKSYGKAWKAQWTATAAEKLDGRLREMPEHYLREKADLFLPHAGDHTINLREESFRSNLVRRVPGLKYLAEMSERHMVTYLNHLRAGTFDYFVKKFPNATDEELKAWANYINIATGRGDLGELAQATRLLSKVFWSPKFTSSRIQYPGMLIKHWQNPRVRKEIAKEQVAIATFTASVFALAKLAGAEVELDPDKPDYGFIKVGNARYDFLAGVLQPTRIVARIGKMGLRRVGLAKSQPKFDEDPLEMMWRFAKYRISPAISLPKELLTGKDWMGKPITVSQSLAGAVTPMFLENVKEVYEEEEGQLPVAVPYSFLGGRVSAYDKNKKKK